MNNKNNAALKIIKQKLIKKYGFKNLYEGANLGKKTLRNFNPLSLDPIQDILPDLPTLRTRSRWLAANNTLGASAINGTADSVVGSGLRLNAQINREIIGLNKKQGDALDRLIENEFSLFADNFYCDSERILNFSGLQNLVFNSTLQSGDCFSLLAFENKPDHIPYSLAIKTIEADRVSNPDNTIDSLTTAGGITVNKSGAPKIYHIRNSFPSATNLLFNPGWRHIQRFGRLTKRLQVIHLFAKFRPGQRRGIPMLAPVIEKIKQLDRYELAEIDAAVIASLFTVFIKSETGTLGKGDEYEAEYADGKEIVELKDNDYALGTGAINGLAEGEDISIADHKRPNTAFDAFVKSFSTQIGAAINIPMEVLLNHFTSSYSASRAALLRAWSFYKNKRAWLISNFNTPIYEEWFTEAVLLGRIKAPGFLKDYKIKQAYLKAVWTGPGMGQIDPVKETKAAILRKRFNFSTGQQEAALISGNNYEDNIIQNAREDELEREISPSLEDINDNIVPDPNLQPPNNKSQNKLIKKIKNKKNISQLNFLDPEKLIENIFTESDDKTD